ncbi:MAG: twin-arginine translocase subunit TatC [Nitrospinota bacterium]
MSDEARMPFTKHLEELRTRLIIIFIGVGVGFGICYYSSSFLVWILQRQLGEKLVFLSPTEAFFTRLKIALFAGIFISMPLTLHQLWLFVMPGLLERERKYTLPFVIFGTIFFVIGASFAYFLILPYGLKFLLSFATPLLVPQIAFGFYVSFAFKLMFAFGIVFEMPLVTIFLVKLGVIDVEFLTRNRKYFFVLAFVIGAILTPPDVFTQMMMAGPLLALYEVSIGVAKVLTRRRKAEEEEEEEEDEED